VYSVAAHEAGIEALAVSGDGQLVATGAGDGSVRVWSASEGRRLYAFEEGRLAIRTVVFAPGDQAVIEAGDDGDVRLWRLAETAQPEVVGAGQEAVSALAVSDDGRFLVGGGWSSLVTVWSLRRRAEIHRLEGHEGAIRTVAVSPDCRLIASGGDDGQIRLWDLEGGRLWRALSGHDEPVHAVSFTPDGRFLLSTGKDATVRLWDVRRASSLKVVKGHAGAISDLAVGREGGLAVTAGTDSTVRLWFLDWEPEFPELGGWDDRVQPFLKVFLRQREGFAAGGALPSWSEHDVEGLLEDLRRRGFGWLARQRVERELEGLVQRREEIRSEEQERTRELAKKRMRQIRFEPLKAVGEWFAENLGLKVAGVTAAVVVVLLFLWSLTTPDDGVRFSKLHRDTALAVQSRGMRLDEGTVVAYQRGPSVGTDNCGEGLFSELLELTLNAERLRSPPLDPGVPADHGFSVQYANAVNCVGKLGTSTLTDQILRRIASGLHPKRVEDLLGVLVRIDAAISLRIDQALVDPSDTVRHTAALTLVYSEENDAFPRLLTALNGEDRAGVEAATFVLTELICLGAIDEAEAFPTVRRFSQNIDPQIRRNATRALVLFEDTKPVREVLDAALDDSDGSVVDAARAVREAMERAL
jgi:hypothetical protein